MSDFIPVPSGVVALVDRLRNDTGSKVDAEHVRDHRWRITAKSDRVLMWAEYEAHSRGRLTWKRSKLYIDGKEVDRAANYDHLVRIFADPDGDEEPDVELNEVDPSLAPEPVAKMYAKMQPLARGEMRLTVRQGARSWKICLEDDQVQLHANFVTHCLNQRRPLREQPTVLAETPLTLIIDGEDLTEKIQGRLDRAAAMMAEHQSAPRNPAVSTTASAAVNTGVQVRRQTVIRV